VPLVLPFYTRPVKVILIRNANSNKDFDIALASTDPDAPAAVLIARYDSRWTIETAHQEPRPRCRRSPQPRPESRATDSPVRVLAQTITITWYALYGDPETDLTERRRQAPWYRQKTTISYNDMLTALRRELIRQDFWAQAHPTTTNTKLTQPQQPPISAAA